jgi:hypothetical protein
LLECKNSYEEMDGTGDLKIRIKHEISFEDYNNTCNLEAKSKIMECFKIFIKDKVKKHEVLQNTENIK